MTRARASGHAALEGEVELRRATICLVFRTNTSAFGPTQLPSDQHRCSSHLAILTSNRSMGPLRHTSSLARIGACGLLGACNRTVHAGLHADTQKRAHNATSSRLTEKSRPQLGRPFGLRAHAPAAPDPSACAQHEPGALP